ncbi:hypothetical protein [Gordonia sp. KTR9]|uniref:hypothetical protein n=1 Tax=Gordonia sp. KTR9 TaxID=337191 RepID=UPI0011D23DB3|nr:hypothetical protein [Gordonia sp. KTR9]
MRILDVRLPSTVAAERRDERLESGAPIAAGADSSGLVVAVVEFKCKGNGFDGVAAPLCRHPKGSVADEGLVSGPRHRLRGLFTTSQ